MKRVQSIEIDSNREEMLPGFSADFPYIATCAELDKYMEPAVPWHWHRAVELFCVKSGTLEYTTPKGKWTFPAGSGGMVNSGVLHRTSFPASKDGNIQQLHLFDPVFLTTGHGTRMEEKYILPLTASAELELIPLYPDQPAQAEILREITQAFELSEQEWGYEFRIREAMTRIWLKLFDLAQPSMANNGFHKDSDNKIKMLMVYVHEHYGEPISVEQLARSIPVSKRACFRLFQENLHMTPVEYIRSYRLQKACQLLARTREPITEIAYSCGLGSGSYFGKVFREAFGCSPLEYRRRWHDCNNNGRF